MLEKIYIVDNYNNEVRPFDEGDQTKIETELKLLQIDLDEKYQQLVYTILIQIYNILLRTEIENRILKNYNIILFFL